MIPVHNLLNKILKKTVKTSMPAKEKGKLVLCVGLILFGTQEKENQKLPM